MIIIVGERIHSQLSVYLIFYLSLYLHSLQKEFKTRIEKNKNKIKKRKEKKKERIIKNIYQPTDIRKFMVGEKIELD